MVKNNKRIKRCKPFLQWLLPLILGGLGMGGAAIGGGKEGLFGGTTQYYPTMQPSKMPQTYALYNNLLNQWYESMGMGKATNSEEAVMNTPFMPQFNPATFGQGYAGQGAAGAGGAGNYTPMGDAYAQYKAGLPKESTKK